MKKISTLALALIAMGTLSMPASAQVKFEPVSSIDASGWYTKTIKVTYTLNLQALVGEAREAISHTSAGYPLESSTSRTNLQNAINAASGEGNTQTLYSNLNDALTAYKNDKTVKMPRGW